MTLRTQLRYLFGTFPAPLVALEGNKETRMATKDRDQSPVDQSQPDDSNTVKNPDEWKTGAEPMTGAQRSYLKTLSDEAKVPFDEDLTKAEASKRIDELRQQNERVASSG
jgi:Protein of unknown function (DUF3072)